MLDLVLSLVVLSAMALFGGAFWLWRKGIYPKQAVLMAILGFVMVVNVAIWLVPASDGAAPAEKFQDRAEGR